MRYRRNFVLNYWPVDKRYPQFRWNTRYLGQRGRGEYLRGVSHWLHTEEVRLRKSTRSLYMVLQAGIHLGSHSKDSNSKHKHQIFGHKLENGVVGASHMYPLLYLVAECLLFSTPLTCPRLWYLRYVAVLMTNVLWTQNKTHTHIVCWALCSEFSSGFRRPVACTPRHRSCVVLQMVGCGLIVAIWWENQSLPTCFRI